MSAPRSIRFEAQTLTKLASYAARHPGLTGSSAAALLVEEGLRMEAHPGVIFKEGPTGRRACLIGGPDVWEVISAIRSARSAEPDLAAGELTALVAENTGVDPAAIRVAVGYYGAYPDEIDAQVVAAEDAEKAIELVLERTRRLLGA
jgi:hypothetical protein